MTTQISTPKLWITREGSINIRRMDTSHLYNSIRTIQTNKSDKYNGYENNQWLTAFKSELTRRNQLFDRVIAIFPKFNTEYRSIVNNNRVFTTKHIKTC